MIDSREIFSKYLFEEKELINAAIRAFKVKKDDILIVNEIDDWLKRNNKPIIFEFKGQLDEEDEYPGYFYYDIFFDIPVLRELKLLKKELGIEDLVITE